ncbi:MAG: hypothetical protein GF350_02560, partial [Chitinivibrionales bacterium]|nr:hypothetical protein [Chitinivibrionales bacterium]
YNHCLFDTMVLAAGFAALILDPDYADAPSESFFDIDSGTVILSVNHSSLIGGISTHDGCFIYKGTSSRNDTVIAAIADSVSDFSAGNEKIRHTSPSGISEGFSIIPSQILFSPRLFTASPETLSPGRYEYAENGWIAEWKFGTVNDSLSTVQCSLAFLKTETPVAANATWSVTRGSIHPTETVSPTGFASPEGINRVSFTCTLDTTTHKLNIVENGTALSLSLDLSTVWAPLKAIKVSEIFPKATDIPEWFELTNVSSMPINIKNWYFGNSEDSVSFSASDIILQKGSFLIVTRDRESFSRAYPSISFVVEPEQWHTLNNYDDTLILWNNRRGAVETACYHNEWFDVWDYQSLERVSSDKNPCAEDAWVVAAHSTPGQPNESETWRNVEHASLSIGPTPFTPNGDTKDDSLMIRIQLPSTTRVSLSIFGFNGKKLYDFAETGRNRHTWNGRKNNNEPAPAGPFFVVAEIRGPDSEKYIRKKGILWR